MLGFVVDIRRYYHYTTDKLAEHLRSAKVPFYAYSNKFLHPKTGLVTKLNGKMNPKY